MARSEEIGTYGELRFMSECVLRGLHVHNPVGTKGYDCIVEGKHTTTKVQVKTTMPSKNRSRWYLKNKGDQSEVYVFHVANSNDFYIVPSEFVNGLKSVGKRTISKFLGNWKIFK